jgi:phospholipid-binding lipoprotein MlaA
MRASFASPRPYAIDNQAAIVIPRSAAAARLRRAAARQAQSARSVGAHEPRHLSLQRQVRPGDRNFFDNLEYPIVMVNDLLQGQFRPFLSDTGRLLLNSTVGIGGLMDPATNIGLDKNDRDFGQTLGKWGARTGPYLVIPFLGPSDVRDAVGRVADEYSNPRHYIRNTWVRYGLAGLRAVDTRARFLDAQGAIDSAYDPYAFLRNVYLQHRDFKVNGGQSANEEQLEQKLLEESADDQQMPEGASAPPQAPPPH